MTEIETSKSLLARLKDHSDTSAWQTFCDVYHPIVQRFCVNRGLQASDANDVAQEVLLRVAKSIGAFRYDASKGRFRDWLYTITRNELSRWIARNPTRLISLDDADSAKQVSEWTQSLRSHILNTALARVKLTVEPKTWVAFEQTWVHGVTASSVAEQCEETVEFVYHAKSRVLKKLKAEVLLLAEDAIWLD